MATYKSRFKGSQVDEAVTIANSNLNKGSADTPIYYDSEGLGQAVQKDSTATVSSVKPLTSGGAYNGLDAVVDYSDIQWENFDGEFTNVGSVQIDNGVASGFSTTSYIDFKGFYIPTDKSFEVRVKTIVTNNMLQTSAENSWLGTTTPGTRVVGSSIYTQWGTLTFWFYVYNTSTSAVELAQIGHPYITELQHANLSVNDVIELSIGRDKEAGKYFVGYRKNSVGNFTYYYVNNIYDLASVGGHLMVGDLRNGKGTPWRGAIDLTSCKVYVEGKLVYSAYPQSDLPPSQGSVKDYVDTEAELKQDQLYSGYGIDVNNSVVSVSDDVFREGEDSRLHSDLKEDYFGELEEGNDDVVLKVIDEMRHSTFDKSKFQISSGLSVVDGVVGGFGANSNRIVINDTIDYNKPFSISVRIKVDDTTTRNGCIFAFLGYDIFWNTLRVDSRTSTNFAFAFFKNTTNVETTSARSQVIYKYNIWYDLIFSWDGATYRLFVKEALNDKSVYEQVFYTTDNTPIMTTVGNIANLTMGSRTAGWYLSGEIDLKEFEVYSDGILYYTGNKTGVDTLKPIKFTAITSSASSPFVNPSLPFSDSGLTISEDGIASGFSSTSYLDTGFKFDFTTNPSFEIEGRMKYVNHTGTERMFGQSVTGISGFSVCRYTQNEFRVIYRKDVDGTVTHSQPYAFVPVGKYFNFKIVYDNSLNTTSLYIDGILRDSAVFEGGMSMDIDTNFTIGSVATNRSEYVKGSIDISDFKIKMNGKIVYQPCLKVPYTLAKDGKKVVDYGYKERVEDQYSQAGYSSYYVLNPSDRGNFTLVGSPSISSDWIANGFSDSDYVYTGAYVPPDKSFEIQIRAIVTSEMTQTGVENRYLGVNSDRTVSSSIYTNTGSLGVWIKVYNTSTSSSQDIGVAIEHQDALKVANLSVGEIIEIKIGRNKEEGKYYSAYRVNETGDFIYAYNSNVYDLFLTRGSFILGNLQPGWNVPMLGSIDLSAFKIYVEGKLTYQAVIPPNYMMATVEENDIVDSYISGTNSYTQRANLQLEQQGTCTANTAVTFPNSTSFIDANYALSIPYVSGTKTKTGFTPARDGDYIAEGYTSL